MTTSLKEAIAKAKGNPLFVEQRLGELLASFEALMREIVATKDANEKDVADFQKEARAKLEEAIKNPLEEGRNKLEIIEGTIDRAMQAFNEMLAEMEDKAKKKEDAVLSKMVDVLNEIQALRSEAEQMRGPKGDKGEDGVNPRPEEVVDLVIGLLPKHKEFTLDPEHVARGLEALDNAKKLDKSAIKGLSDETRAIYKAISDAKREMGGGSGGGGGMGNVQHETKNVSSATTQITTNYAIANGGFAIFNCVYEGAQITRGVHYTVNADRKTLPLTFTPEDGTHIDIIYIRS